MSEVKKTAADIDQQDLIGHLKDDVAKAMLLGGDIICDYLQLCSDPRDWPEDEQTKFMRELLWQYHRYSLTMDLLMEQVVKIRDKVDQLQ